MKGLLAFVVVTALAAWGLWEVQPSRFRHFVEVSYDRPYLVFAFESMVALSLASGLLLAVVATQRELREALIPWSANPTVRMQLAVVSAAAIAGLYGLRQLFQMRSMLQGDWGDGNSFWFGSSPVIALALSPWLVFFAAAVLAAVGGRVGGRVKAAVLVFDLVAVAYLGFVFVNLGHWACVTCSGPAG
jgi:hypothetical protein